MSLAVTRKGNIYQKNNTGKLVGTTIGTAAGAGIAVKNLSSIRSACDELLVVVKEEIAKDTVSLAKGNLTGATEEQLKNLKRNIEYDKLFHKCISGIKKHPIAISAAVCGGTLLLVGCVTDGISNIIRRHKADKKV